jgi:hypothetical protein
MTPDEFIAHYRTQVEAAEAIGMSQPSISAWLRDGYIPWLRQLQIEKITRGKLRADAAPQDATA